MRLESYLINESGGRSKILNMDEAVRVIKRHCMKAWNTYDKHGIALYRGHISIRSDFGFASPSKSERRSANTSNHYTLWMDNSKDWAKFPKRSLSLICSNMFAGAYGDESQRYMVLPFDGSSIGVAPEEDLWDSFSQYYYSLDDFNDDLRDVYVAVAHRTSTGIDMDWKTLKDAVDRMDKSWDKMTPEQRQHIYAVQGEDGANSRLLKVMVNGNLTFKETIDMILNPKKFKLMKAGDKLPQDKTRECWTDGDSILINADHFKMPSRKQIFMEEMNK